MSNKMTRPLELDEVHEYMLLLQESVASSEITLNLLEELSPESKAIESVKGCLHAYQRLAKAFYSILEREQ